LKQQNSDICVNNEMIFIFKYKMLKIKQK